MFLAPTLEEPYISECLSLCLCVSLKALFKSDFNAQCLSSWSSDWAEICHTYHLATIGSRLWYWCQNSCHQLSTAVNSCFSRRDHWKSMIEASCASLFCKMFWKLSGNEFWVLKLFCSSKYYVSLCRYSGAIWHFS